MIDLTRIKDTLQGKPVAIFGLGKSGVATFEACKAAGIECVVADDKEVTLSGATVEDLTQADFARFACLVLAPGVPLTHPEPHPIVLRAQEAGCEIISDIELLHRANNGTKTVAITGTNGKSTTTALIGHVLKEAGVESAVGGNIGSACLSMPQLSENGVYVLEVSSYQIDLCPSFRPDIAVLTNLSPDHLDRHGGMEGYVSVKEKLFEGEGVAVVCVDDVDSKALSGRIENRQVREVSINDKATLDNSKCIALQGDHNWQNAKMAFEVCKALGVADDVIYKALETFPGLEHRQKRVAELNGVAYVNDSKATNDQAAAKALGTYKTIYWIAGGKSKGAGYPECETFYNNVRHGFVIGEAAEEIATSLKAKGVESTHCGTIDKAVEAAKALAEEEALEGAVVLLSPACSSFDQFKSFEARGDFFADAVQRIIAGARDRA